MGGNFNHHVDNCSAFNAVLNSINYALRTKQALVSGIYIKPLRPWQYAVHCEIPIRQPAIHTF